MKETPMQEEFDMEKELQQEFIQELAEFFKIRGDATRILILQTLLEGERNVGDLADVLEMSQSAVSHQLRVLRQNDLVKYRKEGKTVFYSLDDEHIRMVLEQGMTGTLALPTLIAICSAALGKTPLNSLAILGEISIGGTLIKVDELASTLQVCLDSGAKKVLLPITSAGDIGTVPSDLVGAFSLIFYSSAEEAVFKALGVE